MIVLSPMIVLYYVLADKIILEALLQRSLLYAFVLIVVRAETLTLLKILMIL